MVTFHCFWKEAFLLSLKWQMCLYDIHEDIYVSKSIYTYGNWEGHIVSEMIKTLTQFENSTLLDIGGNIGYYTLAAASAGYPVNVFEPVPLNAAMIQQSIQRNKFKNIKLHTTALSDTIGELGMGTSVLNQGGVKHVTKESLTMLPTFTLDAILQPETRPVYIKMDIEGGECNALRGMHNYILNSKQIIGLNLEFGQSKHCCSEFIAKDGLFDILHHKHKLCPKNYIYNNICSVKAWDLIWTQCSHSFEKHPQKRLTVFSNKNKKLFRSSKQLLRP